MYLLPVPFELLLPDENAGAGTFWHEKGRFLTFHLPFYSHSCDEVGEKSVLTSELSLGERLGYSRGGDSGVGHQSIRGILEHLA